MHHVVMVSPNYMSVPVSDHVIMVVNVIIRSVDGMVSLMHMLGMRVGGKNSCQCDAGHGQRLQSSVHFNFLF